MHDRALTAGFAVIVVGYHLISPEEGVAGSHIIILGSETRSIQLIKHIKQMVNSYELARERTNLMQQLT